MTATENGKQSGEQDKTLLPPSPTQWKNTATALR